MKPFISRSLNAVFCLLFVLSLSSCSQPPEQEETKGAMIQPDGILIIDELETLQESDSSMEQTLESVFETQSDFDWYMDSLQTSSLVILPQEDVQGEGGILQPQEPMHTTVSIQYISPNVMSNLTSERIAEINQGTLQHPESGCHALSGVTFMNRAEVLQRIQAYQFPGQPLLNGHPISSEEIQLLEANRNLEAIPEIVAIEHGILTDNADVRTYPTGAIISDSADERAFDYFQESLFTIGEPVLVLHRSADGAYSFVIGMNDQGWVETGRIGMTDAATFDIWQEALKAPAVITEPYVRIEGLGVFRMGTRFPLLSSETGTLRIAFPHNADGQLSTIEVSMPDRADVSAGFLSFSYEAAARQMQKMIGVDYGWGDMHLNYDCSSTVGAVYRCFGLFLPRNTGNMHAIGGRITPLAGLGHEERRNLILASSPGSLLLMRGHVVMYLGSTLDGPKIVHTVTTYSEDGVNLTEAYECRQTALDIFTSSLRSYVDAFDYVISFQ